jgi:hypothetical protein
MGAMKSTVQDSIIPVSFEQSEPVLPVIEPYVARKTFHIDGIFGGLLSIEECVGFEAVNITIKHESKQSITLTLDSERFKELSCMPYRVQLKNTPRPF